MAAGGLGIVLAFGTIGPRVWAEDETKAPEPRANTFQVWFDAQNKAWDVVKPANRRITSDDAVQVRIRGFNFLRFGFEVSVDEKKVESYQFLEKLWGSLLSPSLAGAGFALPQGEITAAGVPPSPEAKLIADCREVYAASRKLDAAVAGVRDLATGMYLNPTLRGQIGVQADAVRARLGDLDKTYDKLQNDIATEDAVFRLAFGNRGPLVKTVSDIRSAASGKAELLLPLADLAVKGSFTKNIGRKASGIYVTLSCQAATEGVAQPIAEESYLVESTKPLVFHAGLTYGWLKDFTFEKVQRTFAAGPEDLFLQSGDSSKVGDFTAFLGISLFERNRGPEGKTGTSVLISLGTSLTDPGKRIFIGPSVAIGRIVVSGGVVLGREKEGEEQSLEPNLFRVLKDSNTAAGFVALTVKLY